MNGAELSLWDRFKIAITPVSSAESLVNEIYSPEHRGMPGLAGFPVAEEKAYVEQILSGQPTSPATPKFVADIGEVVAAPFKQASAAISNAGSALKKYSIIAFIGIAVLVILYAGTAAFIRK